MVTKSFITRNKTAFKNRGCDVEKLLNEPTEMVQLEIKFLSPSSAETVYYYCDYCKGEDRKVLSVSYKLYVKR